VRCTPSVMRVTVIADEVVDSESALKIKAKINQCLALWFVQK
jgi:hypothetical protein